MALVATLGNPVSAWSSPMVRGVWLTVHIVLVLLGYAALVFTAVASVLYLFQERELKSRKPSRFYHRLPPLGTLDDLISKSTGIAFVLITLAVIAGTTWPSSKPRTIDPSTQDCHFILHVGNVSGDVFWRVTAGWRGRKAAIMTVMVAGFSALTWARMRGWGAAAETMKLLITGVSHKTAPVEVRNVSPSARNRCRRRWPI
jgi:ABC-type uncharacterized transport system permease subunit